LPIAPEAFETLGAWVLDATPVTATDPVAAEIFGDCKEELAPET
jgi:hypothetical protein